LLYSWQRKANTWQLPTPLKKLYGCDPLFLKFLTTNLNLQHCSPTISLPLHSQRITSTTHVPSTSISATISFVGLLKMALFSLYTAWLETWSQICLRNPFRVSKQNTLLPNLDFTSLEGECWIWKQTEVCIRFPSRSAYGHCLEHYLYIYPLTTYPFRHSQSQDCYYYFVCVSHHWLLSHCTILHIYWISVYFLFPQTLSLVHVTTEVSSHIYLSVISFAEHFTLPHTYAWSPCGLCT
jgi:hypothetical protein